VTFGIHIALLALPAVSIAQELPDGKGKETVRKICANCHEIETVIGARRTKLGWQRSVEDMISRGAEGADQEMEAVVEYLTANFGKTNVNTASAKEMETALGIPSKEAEAIAEYRAKNGPFGDFEQLKKVPGLSEEMLNAKRSRIAFKP
jgi:competence ComEA-like helix-hairpin-helix protein